MRNRPAIYRRWRAIIRARRVIARLAALAALSGCASDPIVSTRTVEVQVPVAVECPAPPTLARPSLPIKGLTPQSDPADVVRAYVTSVEALQGYSIELETVLDGYR